MRNLILTFLTFLAVISIFLRFGAPLIVKQFVKTPRAGLRVEASEKMKVYINESEKGLTPYQNEELTSGEYLVTLIPESTASAEKEWRGKIKLNAGTLSVVNREIADKKSKSSGETITLEKGQGVTLISSPQNAEVVIDNKSYGKTPISIPDLSVGEHQFLINKEGYLKRSIRASLVEGFNLIINIELALSEPDLSQIATTPITEPKRVVVKKTPLGFLRVRANPTTSSREVARVATGTTLILIEERPGWVKIKTSNGVEGYVSQDYVTAN